MRAFVNYRTKDEAATAQLVSRHLCDRLGERNVFLDNRSIEPGTLFDDELLRNVWRSNLMVSVIGERWLDFPGSAGRAIDDPDDWVHRELAEAFTHQVRVVPLLVGAARLPSEAELPRPLATLAHRQFVRLDLGMPETGFARLDRVLELPSRGEEPKPTGGQSGGIGSVRGNRNISITDPGGAVNIGDRINLGRDGV
ncbi:toll/interleukin-1 receptor domain-containing protein [Actinophytocola oryzae]|uniref:TIR domain-containing protein n=1 Tax=Actinophytocola oryzae TaxID=502181 RepID=A0A4R7W5R1_9PSEU|nr:toll/interleukin-1 receptor domain-containing protein [Actinophytocola oryzae]TDV57458.1 TIR domain-containing protein [Actinophytocola oryzae]